MEVTTLLLILKLMLRICVGHGVNGAIVTAFECLCDECWRLTLALSWKSCRCRHLLAWPLNLVLALIWQGTGVCLRVLVKKGPSEKIALAPPCIEQKKV